MEDSELSVLALLKHAPVTLQEKLREGLQLPRKLLDFALMRRDEQGELALLPAGERLLFQVRCIHVLRALEAGDSAPADDADARAWLLASRFVTHNDDGFAITPRGREWLDTVAVPHSDSQTASST